MASGAQAAKMVALSMMLAILLATTADSNPQPDGTCSVECACAEQCSRQYPRIDDDPPFKITPVCTHRTEHELYARLYLHHTFQGEYRNQHKVLSSVFQNEFGSLVANDWVITDEPGRDTKVVAHAKGIHIQAGMDTEDYYVSFNMVFDDGRFKGSTLQVMGTVVAEGEWAILGGTGEFALARGVIYKTYSKYINQVGDVIELDIHCLYTAMERSKGTYWALEA
ncbi:hypothetical protein CFC21_014671 [Triticum aestivum]|uniref:Dirigent protein n=2 Tax=Triticum aestivum TaxID=4565 RepID=A0A9R1IZF2_WHEAT|nr:dirigent protein 11-like [Triticum aestivum]KAF6998556.1 hypothetical protein CFC21_014671 [Triticum aestivum]